MKLTLAVSSEDPASSQATEQRELNIRNPQATIANLRAAVSVTLKVPSGSFRLMLNGNELSDEAKRLDAVPVPDGATITVIKKRPREGDAAAASAQPPARVHRTERPRAENFIPLEILEQIQRRAAREQAGQDDDEEDDEEDSDEGSLDEDAAYELGLGGDDDFDDEDDEESEGDEEDTPELREQMELVTMLLALPNFETIKSRFDTDPRAVMSDIQTANPQLFNLIARHTQFFLDFLQAGGRYGTGESSGDDDDDSDVDSEVARALADSAPIQSASPTTGAPTASSSGATGSAGAQRTVTEADTRNIEELMQLGFTREQCTEAYFKHGRNPNRAASALFDASAGQQ